MVVVPGRHGINHRIAGIHQGSIGAVEQWSCTPRDQHRFHGIEEPQFPLVEPHHRFPQGQDAIRRRIVGVARFQGPAGPIQEQSRYGKVGRIKIAHSQIADFPALGLEGTDLVGDLQDFRTDHPRRQGREIGVCSEKEAEILGHASVYRGLAVADSRNTVPQSTLLATGHRTV